MSNTSSGARAASAGRRREITTSPLAVLTVATAVLVLTVIVVSAGFIGQPAPHTLAAARAGAHHDTAQSTRGNQARADEQLPDLDQEVPSELDLRVDMSEGRPSYRLGFRSAVRNVGAGPLIVAGSRPDANTSTMTVDQIIDRASGPPRVIPGVGLMEYAVSPSHSHWHYLQFDRYQLQTYELRTPESSQVLVADRKTGFCLGDRYRVTTLTLPGAPTEPVYTGGCGLARPELLQMLEGISVGYGDDYSGFLEGQDLPLDGLPDGRYLLVHRVNVGRRLRELSYSNDAASVLLDLRWEDGRPHLRELASCPDSDRCGAGAPPTDPGTSEIPFSTGSVA
jgi:hypothetical protein